MIVGYFNDKDNLNTYKVNIHVDYNHEIGSSDEICFGDEPITIKQDISDTFDTIIKTSATINLVVRDYVGAQLFTGNDNDIQVEIYKGSNCIFDGFVQPVSYNQDFALRYTDFELSCFDVLSTLDNHNYIEDNEYDDFKAQAEVRSFKSMLADYCLKDIDSTKYNIWYDNSIKVVHEDGSTISDIFGDIAINEMLMLGDDTDDVWTREEVLDEMLKYLNLHIVQYGKDFYIFGWNQIRNSSSVTWINILDDNTFKTTTNTIQTVDEHYYRSNDTQLTINEIYNKLKLTCNLEEMNSLFENPLDDDNLTSPYTNKQRYLLENGESDTYLALTEGDGYVSCWVKDGDKTKLRPKFDSYNMWYMQYMTNKNWALNYYDAITKTSQTVDELVPYDDNGVAINQYWLGQIMNQYTLCPGIFGFGSISYTEADNTKVSEVSLTNYLCIHVGGQEDWSTDIVTSTIDRWNTIVEQTGGIVQYKSKSSVGLITPSDDSITNYLVISGKISLQHPYNRLSPSSQVKISSDTYKFETYYDFYNAKYPADSPELVGRYDSRIFCPNQYWKNKYKEKYGDHFYYKEASGVDQISMVPILVCQMKIGDKYCVQTDGYSVDNPNNEPMYQWMTEDECTKNGYEPTFCIGINPKVGDYFFEKSFDIANTLTIEDNVEATGTAIPIRKSDNLSGNVEFKILCPSYTGWSQQIRKHPTAFRHTSWWTNDLPIMEYVDNIWIQDFEIGLYSDNGLYSLKDEKDLIYESDTNAKSISKKDDIEFKFCTALNASECQEKGILSTPRLNYVVDIDNNYYLKGVYSKYSSYGSESSKKPEEHYINDYYDEYSTPKVEIESTLKSKYVNPFNRYKFSYFKDKTFYIYKMEMNLKQNTVNTTLKEV